MMFLIIRRCYLSASFVLLLCLTSVSYGVADVMVADEVEALKVIGETLGMDWNFSTDVVPCAGAEAPNGVTCGNYYSNGTVNVCHVVSIILNEQSLQGTLPRELVRLPSLQILDLTRNYLSGSIPSEWGSMPNLTDIILQGNRLTGGIPKEIGNISTLLRLHLEVNQLSGELPPELGKLSRIQRLLLTSNNFTGGLPPSFANFTELIDLWLGDNQFSGKIPDFVGKWISLQRLYIQASGFQGPIPQGIELLGSLTDLRISDLNGTEAHFPNINSSNMETLILRSCNLTGELPNDLHRLTSLKTLDVSFNKFSGVIPDTYQNFNNLNNMFLTGNLLSGQVPKWITDGSRGQTNVDLSYNNFTIGISESCQIGTVNLFASSSDFKNIHKSGIMPCGGRCRQSWYSLFINCGGGTVTVSSGKYGDDLHPATPSRFSMNREYSWGYSTTGDFLDATVGIYIVNKSMSILSTDTQELYTTARNSPISLTYYSICLMNGKYNVSLHFAEIIFTDDKTYSSLGKRFFDIYIQGQLVQKDFNIEDEAGGAGKAIVKSFDANVSDGTLEIRFYWAGKGTTSIPQRAEMGVYGPLVSAISAINLDYKPPRKITTGELVVAILAGIIIIVLLIVSILWWKGSRGQKYRREKDLEGLDLQTGSFTLKQIKASTDNFKDANKIGEGGFGSVYRGRLRDGTIVAVKQLSSHSRQGNREFVNEIAMISALRHPHLVKLYGCCIEGSQLLLVYEFLENNNLARALFGPEESQLKLDWSTRHMICVGVARGLAYLHEESRLKVVHRDIKATNILLDKNLSPKISDFGLAKLDEEENTHISTRIAGTYGYMAPEYALYGYLTEKADVYSFGILALEIVSGRSNTSYRHKGECLYLLDWAHVLKESGNLMDLVDPRLGSEFRIDQVMAMIHVSLLCASVSPAARPAMSSVVRMLVGDEPVPSLVPDNNIINDTEKIEAMRRHFMGREEEEERSKRSIESICDSGVPLASTSTSSKDLYPLIWDSDYWQNRD